MSAGSAVAPTLDMLGHQVPPPVVAAIVCPPGCVRHLIDGEDATGRRVAHYGQDFGLVQNYGLSTTVDGRVLDSGRMSMWIDTTENLGANDLRKLAADALAAAEWLEAQR